MAIFDSNLLSMKSVFIACVLFLLCLNGQTQNSGLVILGGYQASGTKTADLNRFVSSFNAYYHGVIPSPLSEYKMVQSHGYNVGGGYRYLNRERTTFSFFGGYAFASAFNRNSATFANGIGMDFAHKMRDHQIFLETGVGIKGVVFINACLDFMFRKTSLRSATVYQDGTKSIGGEYDINGMYTGTTNAFAPGISVGGRVWNFFLTGRVLYTLPFLKTPLYLTDYSAWRYRSHNFPQDFGEFIADVDGSNQENGINANNYNGLLIQLNLEFMIPFGKK